MPAGITAPIAHMGAEALNPAQQLGPNQAQQSSFCSIILFYLSPETSLIAQALYRELGCVRGTKHSYFGWQLPKYHGFWPLIFCIPQPWGVRC